MANKQKEKFYRNNQDIFLRYFDSAQQYEYLIRSGNFEKVRDIIDEGMVAYAEEWVKNFINS